MSHRSLCAPRTALASASFTAALAALTSAGCVDPVEPNGPNDGGVVVDGGGTDAGQTDPEPSASAIAARTLASGRNHSCALDGAGAIRCWGGGGANGELGHGSYENTATPVKASLEGTFVSLTSSANHTCAIRNDGAGFCWGLDGVGALGVSTANNAEATPVALPPERRWVVLAAGASHTCGVTSRGALYCWGSNTNGSLGVGEEGHRRTPTRVGEDNDWVDVAAGSETCAVRVDGTLWCMGHFGGTPRLSPVKWDDNDGWTAIEAFDSRYCGVRDGQLLCFTSDQEQLPDPVDGVTGIEAMSAGRSHTCVIVAGAVVCGGGNSYGQLGEGEMALAPTFRQLGTQTDWTEVSAGLDFSCARNAAGDVYCWGRNSYGELGNGEMALATTFRQVGTQTDWTDVTAGVEFTCALSSSGEAFCFGSDDKGQLGDGLPAALSRPFVDEPVVVDATETFVDLEARGAKVVALYDDDGVQRVTEWGQIDGGLSVEDAPRRPTDFRTDSGWTALAVGRTHVCGVGVDQALYCYGNNSDDKLGTTALFHDTVQVGSDLDWTRVAVGDDCSCGVRATGGLYCWGRASDLGVEIVDTSTAVPQQVVPGKVWTDVVSSSDHRCALTDGGEAWCWGPSAFAELGAGEDNAPSTVPVAVAGGHTFGSLAASRLLTCGITTAGALYCWGNMPIGPATEEADDQYEPVQMNTDTDWVQVTVGDQHVCAIKEAGTLHCLGDNDVGQLGDGSAYESEPVQVGL